MPLPSFEDVSAAHNAAYTLGTQTINQLNAEHDARIEAVSEVAAVKRSIRSLESEIAVNGGYAEFRITGSNDKKRDHELVHALANHPGYGALQQSLIEAEARQSKHEARLEVLRASLQLGRSRLAFAAEQMAFMAGKGAQ